MDFLEVDGIPYQHYSHTEQQARRDYKPMVATDFKYVAPESNVDWDYIKEQEGFVTTGNIPKNNDGTVMGHSGMTVASGYDLGSKDSDSLYGLHTTTKEKLMPWLGLQGEEAATKEREGLAPATLTTSQAKEVNRHSKKATMKSLRKAWKEATGNNFDDLPKNKATPIADVVFHHGLSKTKTYNFWSQVTSDDWVGAEANLRNFGEKNDSLQARRTRGADYFRDNTE